MRRTCFKPFVHGDPNLCCDLDSSQRFQAIYFKNMLRICWNMLKLNNSWRTKPMLWSPAFNFKNTRGLSIKMLNLLKSCLSRSASLSRCHKPLKKIQALNHKPHHVTPFPNLPFNQFPANQRVSYQNRLQGTNSSRVVIFNHEVDILSSTPPFLSCSTMSNRQEMKKKLENIQMTIKDIDF